MRVTGNKRLEDLGSRHAQIPESANLHFQTSAPGWGALIPLLFLMVVWVTCMFIIYPGFSSHLYFEADT